MSTELDTVIRTAWTRPLASRRRLFEGLLRSPTFLLRVGSEPLEDGDVRVVRGSDAAPSTGLSIWAEGDPELDGVWVPVFSSKERASDYVVRRGLHRVESGQFQWVRHEPGQVYALLQAISCFAGIYLNPEDEGGVRLEWPEVNALSEGRVPAEIPVLRQLPVEECLLPEGVQCRVGRLDRKVFGFEGRQVIFPSAGRLELQDFRSLVQLNLNDDETAWAPCRHFVSVLRGALESARPPEPEREEVLLDSLIQFEMYGEAEAACSRYAGEKGRAGYALSSLALVFRRCGKLESCIEVCRSGLRDHPGERQLYRNQALAHAQMEDLEAAREVSRSGLSRFPEDETLLRFV